MPYDPLHLYDVPDVLAAQIVDCETTWRGLKNRFLSPDRLSPNERDSLSDKLAGENASRAAKTVTGILTNPFVWLMFITSPVGSKAIRGGRSLFNVQSEFSSFAKKGMGFLERLVNTPLEVLRGTEGPELALNISANMERLTTAAERMAFPARKRMIDEINAMLPEAHKIDTLRPEALGSAAAFAMAHGAKDLARDLAGAVPRCRGSQNFAFLEPHWYETANDILQGAA